MILFFDTETTGLPRNWKAPLSDLDNWPRMVSIAWLVYDNEGTEISAVDYIIKPDGFIIPADVSNIHGITTERAIREGENLQSVLFEFEKLIKRADYIIAHNMSFDESIVGAEFLRNNIANAFTGTKKICTKESSTDYCKLPGKYGYKWPTLSELHYKLFNTNFDDAHNAAVDINITAKCFWELHKKGVIRLNKLEQKIQVVNKVLSSFSSHKPVIGEEHEGGIVFYFDITEGYGYVAASTDQSTEAHWGNETTYGSATMAVGTGQTNTISILAECATLGIAAQICHSLELGGYNDWFLPSIDELVLMYKNLHLKGVGNFNANIYWSSSEGGDFGSGSWCLDFTTGILSGGNKNDAYYVRAVRRFSVQKMLDNINKNVNEFENKRKISFPKDYQPQKNDTGIIMRLIDLNKIRIALDFSKKIYVSDWTEKIRITLLKVKPNPDAFIVKEARIFCKDKSGVEFLGRPCFDDSFEGDYCYGYSGDGYKQFLDFGENILGSSNFAISITYKTIGKDYEEIGELFGDIAIEDKITIRSIYNILYSGEIDILNGTGFHPSSETIDDLPF